MTPEAFLESIGYEFDKDKDGLWKEETWCSEYNEHKIKDIFEMMEQYASEKVKKYAEESEPIAYNIGFSKGQEDQIERTPTDEEIEEELEDFKRKTLTNDPLYYQGLETGIKWMREQLAERHTKKD